jgi:hypothetical protein
MATLTVNTDTYTCGPLGPGESEAFDIVLTGLRTYDIFVEPDQPGVDFDLYVLDERGNVVAVDDAPNRDAVCSVTPQWTGPFQLVIECARGISNYQLTIQEYA